MDHNAKSLFMQQVFTIQETLKSNELNNIVETSDYNNEINDILLEKIKNKWGDLCHHLGYIEKKSIMILSRSIGSINTSHFNGDIQYNIRVQANICKPSEGNRMACSVVGVNKIGIFAVADPVQVIIATAHHDSSDIFDSVQTGDKLIVEIINYKFKLNSKDIKVIGKFIEKMN